MKKKEVLSPEKVKERFSKLESDRRTWEDHWQELTTYILPNRSDITVRTTPGEKKNLVLLDNTAMMSNELLAGSLHGMLTSPASPFFAITTGQTEIDELDEVRKWLQEVERRMHNVINGSNFQTEVHQLYLDLTCLGTAGMSIVEDDETVVRFMTHHIRELYVAENNKGQIDEVYRKFKWNIRQIVGEFGEDVVKLSKNLTRAWQKQSDECFEIINAVYPRDVASTDFNDTRRYVCQYILCGETETVDLEVEYFREKVFVVPRWTKVSGETYGRSPGMNALPDAKTLNKMTETVMIGAQKAVDPPLQAPDDGFVLPLRTRPGGISYYRSGSQDRLEPIFNDTRVDFGFAALRERRGRIRESFFIDQLQLNQGPQMTATEVNSRDETRMRFLGPMMGRQHSEFLRPMIDRTFEIMARRDMIPPAPQVLTELGIKLDVTYSSMIAKAQRMTDAQNISRAMQAIAPFASMDQTIFDNFNGDKAVVSISKIHGLPQEILRDKVEVEQIRNARAKAQQAAMAQAQKDKEIEQATAALPGATAMAQVAEQ